MRLFALAICSLTFWPAAAADLSSVTHVPHLDQVNDHLYRSGQPTTAGLEELGAFGIKRVINLRGESDKGMDEGATLKKLGIKYVNMPFPAFSAPSQEDVGSVLALLVQDNKTPTLVHCLRGKDRTGTVIACYRILHDHWSNADALQEAKVHGMSSLERGMRLFVLNFTAASNGTPLPSDSR